jgi:hypothetical protein
MFFQPAEVQLHLAFVSGFEFAELQFFCGGSAYVAFDKPSSYIRISGVFERHIIDGWSRSIDWRSRETAGNRCAITSTIVGPFFSPLWRMEHRLCLIDYLNVPMR